jgi:hypothetical protein
MIPPSLAVNVHSIETLILIAPRGINGLNDALRLETGAVAVHPPA